MAAMPSPRPIAPMPSLVVALMPTRAASIPSAAAILLAHGGEMRADLRRFRDQRRVDVDDPAFLRRQELADPPQNLQAADAANRFIRVRKMMADVALADRAEQRIGDGVGEHVRIGMARPVRARAESRRRRE